MAMDRPRHSGQNSEAGREERSLADDGVDTGPDEGRSARLEELKIELDTCWDLLRQRKGHEEFRARHR